MEVVLSKELTIYMISWSKCYIASIEHERYTFLETISILINQYIYIYIYAYECLKAIAFRHRDNLFKVYLLKLITVNNLGGMNRKY